MTALFTNSDDAVQRMRTTIDAHLSEGLDYESAKALFGSFSDREILGMFDVANVLIEHPEDRDQDVADPEAAMEAAGYLLRLAVRGADVGRLVAEMLEYAVREDRVPAHHEATSPVSLLRTGIPLGLTVFRQFKS